MAGLQLTTPQAVAGYVLSRGLAAGEAFRDGLVIRDLSRRNRAFAVESPDGTELLLKQDSDPEGVATIAREAAVYAALGPILGTYPPSSFLPACHAYDVENRVLILELVPGARDLGGFVAEPDPCPFEELGRALAVVHGPAAREAADCLMKEGWRWGPPDILRAGEPGLAEIASYSFGQLRLIEILQTTEELCRHLEALAAEWNPGPLVHHDMRWDNCLVTAVPGARRGALRIVDWELAGPGDPLWDVGSVFAAFLTSWVLSIPLLPDSPPDLLLNTASLPLERMRPALGRFWDAYSAGLPVEALEWPRFLVASVRWGAARLVQTAFEHTQWHAGPTGHALCLLQLAANLARRPRAGAVGLLGLPA